MPAILKGVLNIILHFFSKYVNTDMKKLNSLMLACPPSPLYLLPGNQCYTGCTEEGTKPVHSLNDLTPL